MSASFTEGMRVNTRFGPGWIKEVRSKNNIIVSLDSKSGICIRQKADEITLEKEIKDEEILQLRSIVKRIKPTKVSGAPLLRRKAVEALRFGVVPETMLQEMTIGFDSLRSWVTGCLPHTNSGKPTVSEVYGPYGSGKSHTMSIVRHIAKLEGYVTTRVEIDGGGISFGDPEGLLANLWRNLSAEDLHSATPLLELYLKTIDRGERFEPKIVRGAVDRIAHNFALIRNLKERGQLESFEYMIDAILSSSKEFSATEVNQAIGSYLYIRRMIGIRVDERPFDFLVSLFGHAKICELAGYKGLVVTIDEFEVQRQFETRLDRARALIDHMTEYLRGEIRLSFFPCALFVATIEEEDSIGDEIVDEMVDVCDGDYHKQEELKESDLITISQKIFKLYCETYGVKSSYNREKADNAFSAVGNESGRVRAFIKHYVALLDQEYGPPQS